MVFVCQLSAEHDMSIYNTAYGIGNRLVGIVTLYQNRIDACNGALLKVAAALEELWQL